MEGADQAMLARRLIVAGGDAVDFICTDAQHHSRTTARCGSISASRTSGSTYLLDEDATPRGDGPPGTVEPRRIGSPIRMGRTEELSYVVGGPGGGIVRSQNWVAQQTAMRQRQNAQAVERHRLFQQNLRLSRVRVQELVEELTNTDATVDDLRAFREWLDRVQPDEFDPDTVPPEVESNPFSWLLKILPDNKSDWYQFVGIIVGILGIVIAVIAMKGDDLEERPVVVTIEQKQIIVQRIEVEFDVGSGEPGAEPNARPDKDSEGTP